MVSPKPVVDVLPKRQAAAVDVVSVPFNEEERNIEGPPHVLLKRGKRTFKDPGKQTTSVRIHVFPDSVAETLVSGRTSLNKRTVGENSAEER